MKTKALTDHHTRQWLDSALPLSIALLLPIALSSVHAAGAEEIDEQLCAKQLEQVFQAVQAYRRDHKDLPNWLTDLVPNYLADTNLLICPITRRTGQTHTFQHLKDPRLPTAYLYEFSPLPTGQVGGGGQIRMRDFKRRQMGLVGGEVPIVRCHLHNPVLNLGFNGRVYESPVMWEQNFTNVVDFSAWSIDKLFPDALQTARPAPQPNPVNVPEMENELTNGPAPLPSLPIPPRPEEATPQMVDLTDYFHAALKETWHPGTASNDLARLPSGIQELQGVRFDIRGVIQLNGGGMSDYRAMSYPRRIKGIKIGRQCARLHFLHATGWAVADGVVVGRYVLQYSDGSSQTIPIVYGEDIRDWWIGTDNVVQLKHAQVAWQGLASNGNAVRIYKRTWENPQPEREVADIEFISNMTRCAPFLLAITTEP